jgi:hypothetical protein
MPQVPIERTPVSADEARVSISDAWRARFGAAVEPDVLALLLALWDLETGTGQSQFNWNFGNLVEVRPDSRPFYIADDSGNTRKFKAFEDIDDGAEGFVAQVTSTTRPEWHQGLLTGDPEEFVRALKGRNGGPEYFEAPLDRYLQTFLGRWRRYEVPKALPPSRGQPEPAQPPPTRTRTGLPLALLGFGSLAFLWWRLGRTGRR